MTMEKIEEEMIDAGKTGPREVKGGVFAPSDIPVIKRALHVYLTDCIRAEDDGANHPDIPVVSSLLHRLGRVS